MRLRSKNRSPLPPIEMSDIICGPNTSQGGGGGVGKFFSAIFMPAGGGGGGGGLENLDSASFLHPQVGGRGLDIFNSEYFFRRMLT